MTGKRSDVHEPAVLALPFPVIGESHPLRQHAVMRLYLAFAVASTIHLAASSGFLIHPERIPVSLVTHTVILRSDQFTIPQSIRPDIPQPQAVRADIAQPKFAIPEPVEDFRAPDTRMANDDEISHYIDAQNAALNGPGPSDSIVVEFKEPPTQTLAPGEFVAYEEPPRLIRMPAPVYPEMARAAEVEGTLRILVLVGKDGKVKDARADNELPMLREAALAAARQAVFSPALQQHRPVEVWVSVPMTFSLR